MLPGFRFLFAAIVLSISILVFGLGAAALLRAAHEEFASNPAWHAAPDATFTQQAEATRPVLAMLRVDPPPAPKASDNIAAIAPAAERSPAAPPAPAAAVPVPAEQAAMVSAPVEPDKVAAPNLEETSLAVAAQPEIPASETPAPSEAAAANAAADQTKIASVEQGSTEQGLTQQGLTQQGLTEQGLPPANEVAPTGSETTPAASTQASALVPTQASSRKIATLGDPATTIGPQTDSATPDRSIIKKRQHARRAAQRRRLALLRARQAQLLALQQQQQPFDLFGQPQPLPLIKPAAAARSR